MMISSVTCSIGKVIILCGLIIPALTVGVYTAASGSSSSFCGHSDFHYWYSQLFTRRGVSCCDNKDCRCVRVKFVNGQYAVQIEPGGIWFTVDENTEIFYDRDTPDGGPHACVIYNEFLGIYIVRCLVLPPAV